MPIPDFVVELRRHVGHAPLWLVGVTAVVVRPGADGDEILLAQRSDTGRWTPVTGIVDPGEDPDVAVVREVAEETRVRVRVERLASVAASDLVTHVNGDQARYLDHTFRCAWVGGEPSVGDDENLATRWWPVADLSALPGLSEVFRARIDAALADEVAPRLGAAGGAR